MKNVENWLTFFLLLILADFSAAQAPSEQRDQPDAKGPSLLSTKPLKEEPKDDELRKLLKARYNEALAETQAAYRNFEAARGSYDAVGEAEQRRLHARLELCDTPAERVAVLTQSVELAKQFEKVAQTRIDAGRGTESVLHRARYQRLDLQIQLLRAKREADKAKGK